MTAEEQIEKIEKAYAAMRELMAWARAGFPGATLEDLAYMATDDRMLQEAADFDTYIARLAGDKYAGTPLARRRKRTRTPRVDQLPAHLRPKPSEPAWPDEVDARP